MSAPAGTETAALPAASPRGPFHPLSVLNRLRSDRAALAGGIIVALFIVLALFAPWIAPYDPNFRDTSRMNEAPWWVQAEGLTKPVEGSSRHVLGLDVSGRDVLSRVIYGTRTSLLVGAAVVTLASLIGVTLGAFAGYAGGTFDSLVMRVVDIMLAFPFLILALAVISIFPHAGTVHIALVLGLTSWPGICRIMRAQVLKTRELDYVNAARGLGATHHELLLRHILPNCIAPVIIWFTIGIAGAVMAQASLSFLGLGDPEALSWGTMIDDGLQKSYFPREWWPVTGPAIALALLVLGFNLLGDGLQDAINPRLAQKKKR